MRESGGDSRGRVTARVTARGMVRGRALDGAATVAVAGDALTVATDAEAAVLRLPWGRRRRGARGGHTRVVLYPSGAICWS
jgi:hypothetical protein